MWNTKAWNIALLVLLPAVFVSCSDHRQKTCFDRIENVAASDPDRALRMLDEIDTLTLNVRQKALYTSLMLRSEVEEYGYNVLVSAQQIKSAAEYFEQNGDKVEIAKIWTALAKEKTVEGNHAVAADYYSYAASLFEAAAADSENKLQGARLRTVIILLFLFVLLVIFFNYRRLQRIQKEKTALEDKAENERLMSIAEDLRARLQEAEKPKGKISEDFAILERLFEQYYIYEGTENLQPKILKEVNAIVSGLRENPSLLEERLNVRENRIVERLRTQFPGLKEEDVRLFCFSASGFSSTTISTLMGRDKQYIYNRLYRLRGRISISEAPDKDEFIRSLSK